jgi:DNA polymerase I-like protein with 3'-5' exonuclease and polymerase domains/uracil-DNA glycosylase
MAFFFNAAKTEAVGKKATKPKSAGKRGDIPIASLRQLGCSVCPRDTDPNLVTPKMRPSGAKTPSVYLLGATPSKEDDDNDNHWLDKAGVAIFDKFGRTFMTQQVRSNYITQCRGEQSVVEVECCRNRIVADIEQSKPLVIVTIGDGPLNWATGISGNAMSHRGTKMVVKVGNHTCWLVPILYPNYVFKKSYKKSEYELTLEHDVRFIKSLVDGQELAHPYVYGNPKDYDAGVELITGNEPNAMQTLERALADLAGLPRSSVDIETNGLRPFMLKDPHIWTAAVGSFNRVVAFPVDHPEGWGTDARRSRVRSLFNEYLLHSGRKAAHNLSMELEWFNYFFGADVVRRTEWDDTMAIAHTLDERSGTKSLDYQCRIMFGLSLKAQSNLDVTRLLEYPLLQVLRYNGMDSKWTDKLRDHRMPELEANRAYMEEYERKVRLAPTLVLTEAKGLPTDMVYAQEQGDALQESATKLEAKILRTPEVRQYNVRFGPFSPTNPDHVLKLMRDVCQRDEVRVEDKRTKEVRWTSDEEALNKIPAKEVPSAGMILEHRGVSKLLSTYINPVLTRKIVCQDGMMRPKYGSMIAVTGRLAAEDPNVQNWPKRKNREIRGVVAADPGETMLALDYGQIEFRVVGMASEDHNLVKYCWTSYDVHKYWAERMVQEYPSIKDYIVETFNVDWDEKGIKTLRQEAKNGWVFPQLFGSSVASCAEQLHLPDYVADTLAAEFWDEFSGVKKWQENLLKSYEKNLYVETLGGRRRRGPMTKNEIINMPIQGTAADIVTKAMDAISEMSYALERPEIHPSLNVHDDLSFFVPDNEVQADMDLIATEMCRHRFDYINVPLVVEASVGKRWHDLKEVKVYRSHEMFNITNPYQGD